VRKIDFGFDLFFTTGRARRSCRRRRCLSVCAEVLANQLGLVLLQRAGVRFLLGNAHFGEDIEDRLALDL